MIRRTLYAFLPLVVTAGGKPVAAFAKERDANRWIVERMDEYPGVNYLIEDQREVQARKVHHGDRHMTMTKCGRDTRAAGLSLTMNWRKVTCEPCHKAVC